MPFELPEDLRRGYVSQERRALSFINSGNFRGAMDIYMQLYDMILERQLSDESRYHKGGPLHMTGYCLAHMERITDSLPFFLLAYVEDVITDGLEEAQGYPAYRVLIETFVFDFEKLTILEEVIIARLRESDSRGFHYFEIRDPDAILEEFLHVLDVQRIDLIQYAMLEPESRIDGRDPAEELPGTNETRVFVGGSYQNISILRFIRKLVFEQGYWGIMAIDYDISMDPREKCFKLLGKCKYAIFDITLPGGQNNEIEEAGRIGISTLLVFQAMDDRKKPPLGSSILPTNLPRFGYRTFEELKSFLPSFLPKIWGP